MRDFTRDEKAACGIGFVADESGRGSRDILDRVLGGIARVTHRGGPSTDGSTSDGAGLLLPLPASILADLASTAGLALSEADPLGVAMVFLPPSRSRSLAARRVVERGCEIEGLTPCGWRAVPVDDRNIGVIGRSTMPAIFQLFFRPGESTSECDSDALERRCHRARRRVEEAARTRKLALYVCSWSFRTCCYKALCSGDRIADFYPDLMRPTWEICFGIFHQRFSTNTTPSWERAQPYRMVCHNGEINTIEGNERKMCARSLHVDAEGLDGPDGARSVIDPTSSDSGKLDAALELLVRNGRELCHSIAMLIPEAWEADFGMPESVRSFYHYHDCLMEPWGGPAAVIATDGLRVAAILDANGFRPLRWWRSEGGLVAACSEAGAITLGHEGKLRRGRLGPGQMLCVDPGQGGFLLDHQIKLELAKGDDYGARIRESVQARDLGHPVKAPEGDLALRQRCLGWSGEELAMVLTPMANEGVEPRFSMGDDVPPPVLGRLRRPLHHALRQRFAQVTNPPIDSLREMIAMSLRTCIGARAPLLGKRETPVRLLELSSFFVFPSLVEDLLAGCDTPFEVALVDATFPVFEAPDALEMACRRLALEAEQAVRDGAGALVIRDGAFSLERAPVPMLLALGAIHQRLVGAGLRNETSLVCDCDELRDTHHFATLLGYGADLLCPRLALEVVAKMAEDGRLETGIGLETAQSHYRKAVEDGVRKVMSKMGVSTVQSYRGAQLFEVIGLADEVVDLCLTGTRNPIGGIGWGLLGAELRARHEVAWAEGARLPNHGLIRARKGGEYHANNPDVIAALHEAIGFDGGYAKKSTRERRERGEADPIKKGMEDLPRSGREDGAPNAYARFAALVHGRPPSELQDLLDFVDVATGRERVPLDEVEPIESVCRRFATAAMSHGSLSREVHESMAIAMNRIGGRSNCGEGGEARERFATRGSERDSNSRIKQIASARFGVTPEYCVAADELQIKMGQGSKPGEGGQIPSHKVTSEIARLRHTQPGVGLISPPPHHDIYSIEDLAQLIFDLKQVNDRALVSVKLVSSCGVGTIAAGVAKGLADGIVISGSSGGSGASPLSSIKHAGLPWVIGLAETQRALMENGLRDRVRVAVDGGLKSGRDVMVAALLGADDYHFGTAALISQGCLMVRNCHLDSCPTGIATQNPELRHKFRGAPEQLVLYLRSVAQEVRELLAGLGFRSLDEAIGRQDLLFQVVTGDHRIDSVELSPLLSEPIDGPRRFEKRHADQQPRSVLGDEVALAAMPILHAGGTESLAFEISNRDRAVGAALGGAVARAFGADTPPGRVRVVFRGAAGQSFGAFLTAGVDFSLDGEANDGVAKGMAGGCIAIRAPADDAGDPHLAGNAILYGATGGEVYIAGAVGERFAVRNSGALGVAERAGRHGCEYMTGGTVLLLGPIGSNLGAGMSGGDLFVHNEAGTLPRKLNTEFVRMVAPSADQLESCRATLERHHALTGSRRAEFLLARWAEQRRHFHHVVPLASHR
jgi:glutamate synthase domain-containing protein 2/glutamate synthase domain-containing protein 1/glutamate synthase domain-containing protein 3